MFNNYIFRCSSLGKLMTDGRSKSEPLSQTTKTYLRELWLEETFGVKKEVSSKYLTKGIECEEKSLTLYSSVKSEFLVKNEKNYSNDFVKGTPDAVTETKVIDIKTSWDIFTFFDAELTKDYYWQLLGYLWLTGKTDGVIAYCLVNTPYHLFEQEEKRIYFDFDCNYDNPEYIEAIENLKKRHYVDYIPESKRIKEFEVKFSQEEIDKLCKRIEECRTYLNQIEL